MRGCYEQQRIRSGFFSLLFYLYCSAMYELQVIYLDRKASNLAMYIFTNGNVTRVLSTDT